MKPSIEGKTISAQGSSVVDADTVVDEGATVPLAGLLNTGVSTLEPLSLLRMLFFLATSFGAKIKTMAVTMITPEIQPTIS